MKPVYPQPGYTEADAVALLKSRQFVYAECFTITPLIGDPLRFTNAGSNVRVVPIDGTSTAKLPFLARTVVISGLRFKTSIGTEVDEQQIDLSYPSDPALWQGVLSFPRALQLGRLDAAVIRRDRFFASAWGQPWVFGLSMFAGRVSTVSNAGRQSATISVKSDLVLLDVQAPRDLFIPQCKHTWADPGCGVIANDFAQQVNISNNGVEPTVEVIPWSGITDTFAMGTITIEGADNVNRTRTISSVVAGSYAKLIYPLDFIPAVGTPVLFYPNCRRLFANCGNFHDNPEEHYMGFPYIPVAETAY